MSVIEVFDASLDARVRMFRAGEEVDCFAVLTDSHVVVIDTFGTPEDAIQMMQLLKPKLEHRQLLVINTHQHYDHAWGNSIFTPDGEYPAPIIAHQHSKRVLERQRAVLLEKRVSDSRFATVEIVPPSLYFSETCSLDLGSLTLELFPAFGHSNDQVAIWIPEIQTLLPADALEFPFPELEVGEFPALMKTFQALKAKNPKVIAPCHGGIHDARLIDWNLAYFTQLETQATKANLPISELESPDLPERLGFSYSSALQMLGLQTGSDFYRQFHQHNCQAILRHVRG
jgi:glyoxylase-like metal-dependent hydrolase (beta-lactamase superfamily II)